jgi:lipoprotein-anchoring transpeptidase ErfK/SrfK
MDRPAALPAVLVVVLVTAALAAVAAAAGTGRPAAEEASVSARQREPRALQPVERVVGQARGVADPSRSARTERRDQPGFGVVRVRAGRTVELRAKPRGRAVASVGARTEFGSRSVMSVVGRRGRWLAVTTTAMGNGRTAWVRADSGALDRGRVRTAISVDLSRRTVELRRGKRLMRRVRVAVGRPGSATPRGRFAVTDKLPGSRYGSYYGCCILALNGTQPNPPPGWRGGNRLAIHGTNAPGSIGKASSAGCLRAADGDLRALMRAVPLGTPVFVHG